MYDGERWQTFVIEVEPVAGNRIRDLARPRRYRVDRNRLRHQPVRRRWNAHHPAHRRQYAAAQPRRPRIQPDAAGGLWLGAGGAAL